MNVDENGSAFNFCDGVKVVKYVDNTLSSHIYIYIKERNQIRHFNGYLEKTHLKMFKFKHLSAVHVENDSRVDIFWLLILFMSTISRSEPLCALRARVYIIHMSFTLGKAIGLVTFLQRRLTMLNWNKVISKTLQLKYWCGISAHDCPFRFLNYRSSRKTLLTLKPKVKLIPTVR